MSWNQELYEKHKKRQIAAIKRAIAPSSVPASPEETGAVMQALTIVLIDITFDACGAPSCLEGGAPFHAIDVATELGEKLRKRILESCQDTAKAYKAYYERSQ